MSAALEKIELGDATVAEARLAISELLKEGSEASYGRLYAVLGAWLWKALDGRRRDEELRQWFDIIRRTSATLSTKNAAYAERFRAFYDLLEMSIATSKIADVSEILSRQHVVPILQLLRDAGSRPVEKAAIAEELGLGPANLSRILHMMANARLVERTSYGRQAQFAITREGSIALLKKEAMVPATTAVSQDVQAQVIAEAEELFRNILKPTSHDPLLRPVYGQLQPGLGKTMLGQGHALRVLGGLEIMNLVHRLASTPTPASAPVPSAAPPAQARQVKKYGKRFFGGVQVVTVNEKKPEANRTHLLVESVHQQKAAHFVLHAHKEENENHVD